MDAVGAFILEGAKPVYDVLLHHPASIQDVGIAADYEVRESDQQRRLRESLKISSFRCSTRLFASLSNLENPQGILAVVKQPRWNEEKLLERPKILGLYGEHLQDPANVGAIIRTAGNLPNLISAVRREIQQLDPNIPVASNTLVEKLTLPLLPARITASLLGGFGLMALALAAIGIYGVMSHSVAQRTHEIGVRMALGASSRDVTRLVLSQLIRPVGLGLFIGGGSAAGLAALLLATPAAAGIGKVVHVLDPVAYAVSVLVILAACLAAASIPAARAARLDPAWTLRQD